MSGGGLMSGDLGGVGGLELVSGGWAGVGGILAGVGGLDWCRGIWALERLMIVGHWRELELKWALLCKLGFLGL